MKLVSNKRQHPATSFSLTSIASDASENRPPLPFPSPAPPPSPLPSPPLLSGAHPGAQMISFDSKTKIILTLEMSIWLFFYIDGIIAYNDLVVPCPQFDVVLQTEIWLTFLSTFCAKTLAFEVLNMY